MTTSHPTKQELISLVESMCEVQDRMLGARGMPEHIQRPYVDNMDALKAPVFLVMADTYRYNKGAPSLMRLHCFGRIEAVMFCCFSLLAVQTSHGTRFY